MTARRPNPRRAREAVNWRVLWCGPTKALAIEPGGEHEWVFEGQPYPFTVALDFAASRLRAADR